jgi:hypothetical protein
MDLVRGQRDSSGSAEMTTLFFHKTAKSDYIAMRLPLANSLLEAPLFEQNLAARIERHHLSRVEVGDPGCHVRLKAPRADVAKAWEA